LQKQSAAPKWLRAAILVLAAFAIMSHTSREVSDNDTWWHLKTGQYMLEHHALPVPDPFSYTTYLHKTVLAGEAEARDFNLTHEWLAQILFYRLYSIAGYAGLVMLRSLLLTGFCAVVGWAVYRRTGGFYRAVLATLAAATVAYQFLSDRPYLITFLFLGLTIVIVESGRRLWLLLPLFLVWANCHGGFFMGWAVLGAYCGEALLLRLRGKPPAGEKQLWLFSLGSILITGLNPNGLRVLPIMLTYRNSPMQSTIWEWQYPLPWPPVPFSVLLACALVVLVWQRRRARIADWLLLLIFGAAAVSAVRNIILAGIVGPLIIFTYVPWKRVLPVAAEYALAALLIVAAIPPIARGDAFQFHASEWKFCGGAVDFLKQHHITAAMFNSYEMGGYLIWRLWPQERVFIDGRALSETVFQDYNRIAYNAAAANGLKSADDLLNDYRIDVILMNGFEYTSGTPYNLPAALSDPSQKEWKLVYQDAQSMVYMRHPPPDVKPLNSFEALAGLEMQCSAYLDHDRGHTGCARGLADLFAKIGDGARASKWQAIHALHPEQ
jgi:hypothetical protein